MTDPLGDAAAEAHASRELEEFLLAIGRSQLAAGYPVDDVTQTLHTVARAYDRPDLNVAVLPGVVIVDDPLIGRARVITEGGLNALRLDQAAVVHDVAQEARRGEIAPRDGTRILDALPDKEPRYPGWLSVIGYGVASTGFALIFRVSPWAILMAAALGLFVGWLLMLARPRPNLMPLVPPVAAMVCAFSVFSVASLIDSDVQPLRVVIAPLIALVPGAALTRATQELASGHLISGSSRLVAAIVQVLVLTFGILVGSLLARVSPYDISDLTETRLPIWVAWVGAVVYAVGQAVAFNEPRGALRYVVPLLLLAFSVQQLVTWQLDAVLAAGVAAAVALFAALLIQDRMRNGPPSFVLFTPVFWLLVPGSLGLVGLAEVITGASLSGTSAPVDSTGQAGLPSITDVATSTDTSVILSAGASIIAITIGMQIASIAGRLIRQRPDAPETQMPGHRH
ncbi:MAG: threonine/serine ThrE exporter family protein [Candidatus Nanopelagicales bacterium]